MIPYIMRTVVFCSLSCNYNDDDDDSDNDDDGDDREIAMINV